MGSRWWTVRVCAHGLGWLPTDSQRPIRPAAADRNDGARLGQLLPDELVGGWTAATVSGPERPNARRTGRRAGFRSDHFRCRLDHAFPRRRALARWACGVRRRNASPGSGVSAVAHECGAWRLDAREWAGRRQLTVAVEPGGLDLPLQESRGGKPNFPTGKSTLDLRNASRR